MWGYEDKECVRLLSAEGMSARDIEKETGIPLGTIHGWRRSWGITTKNKYDELYKGTVGEVQERLIKIMQEAPVVTYTYFNSKDSGTPAATTYRKYFGSWDNALSAAGITNSCTMKPGKPTRIYLVEFEGFYKIGITQQTVHERLGGRYPPYKVIIDIETTLEEAKNIEKDWLKTVKPFQFIPTTFPSEGRGFTECFKI